MTVSPLIVKVRQAIFDLMNAVLMDANIFI